MAAQVLKLDTAGRQMTRPSLTLLDDSAEARLRPMRPNPLANASCRQPSDPSWQARAKQSVAKRRALASAAAPRLERQGRSEGLSVNPSVDPLFRRDSTSPPTIHAAGPVDNHNCQRRTHPGIHHERYRLYPTHAPTDANRSSASGAPLFIDADEQCLCIGPPIDTHLPMPVGWTERRSGSWYTGQLWR